MTQVEDEKCQARHAGGLFTTHGQMKGKQNNCNLFSCLEEEEEVVGCGVFPGFQSDAIPAPHVSDTYRLKPNTLSQQHLGLGITSLFVAMATLDSLSFPSLSHEQM